MILFDTNILIEIHRDNQLIIDLLGRAKEDITPNEGIEVRNAHRSVRIYANRR